MYIKLLLSFDTLFCLVFSSSRNLNYMILKSISLIVINSLKTTEEVKEKQQTREQSWNISEDLTRSVGWGVFRRSVGAK